jgi:hypothetical protein
LLRVSELASIPFASVVFLERSVRFSLSKPRKAQRSGPLPSFLLPVCPGPNTCPVEALKSYIARSESE